MEEREKHQFSRFTEDNTPYLISIRKAQIIPPHGTKYHYKHKPRRKGICENYWYLYTGAYYIYQKSKQTGQYNVHKLVIREKNEGLIEEHIKVKYVPEWLKELVSKLPEYNEKDFNGKYTLYSTKRHEGQKQDKGHDGTVLTEETTSQWTTRNSIYGKA